MATVKLKGGTPKATAVLKYIRLLWEDGGLAWEEGWD